MKLPFSKDKPKKLSEIFIGKTDSQTPRLKLTEDLIKESKGLVTPNDFSASYTTDEEYVVPHKVAGQALNWKIYSQVYNQVGIVKNAINNTANFAIQSGYELEGTERDKTRVSNWIDKHNFDLIMLNIMKQMLIYGNAYLEIPSADDMKLLPVDQMYVVVHKGGEDDGDIKGYKQLVGKGILNPPKWEPEEIVHFKWNELGTSFYGIPDIRPALSPIKYMLQYLEDIGEIIHRYGHPIFHWRMGTEDTAATDAQINTLKATLNDREVGEDLVTSWAVEGRSVSSDMKLIQLDGLLKIVENQLIGALEVPDFFIRGGETSNRATSQTMLQSFDRRVKALRQTMGQIIEDKIFKAKLNTGIHFVWKELSTEGELNKSQILANLVSKGEIPTKLALNIAGYENYADDYEKEFSEDTKRQAKRMKAQPQPQPFGQKGEPGKPEPEPKEDDFQNQAEYLKAYEEWLKNKKRLNK